MPKIESTGSTGSTILGILDVQYGSLYLDIHAHIWYEVYVCTCIFAYEYLYVCMYFS